MKIKALLKTQPHPTFVKIVKANYDNESDTWICKTTDGLNYSTDLILLNEDVFGHGAYKITNITEDSVVVLDYSGNLVTYSLNDLEWDKKRQDYFIKTEDEIDEYMSGYADAIRDCVEYVSNKDQSVIRTVLKKMGFNYLSEFNTDEKIGEFVSKRFEKKPQLTLDKLKEIVGYDFDLV